MGRRPARPAPRNGQRALPLSTGDNVPELPDFTAHERMAGEYAVMGIYPRGHVMEFVRPTLSPDVLRAADIDALPEGQEVLVAGWPVARQHPRGMEGTVFVTIEDETGDVQLIVWPGSSHGTGGSWGIVCYWPMESSPDTTVPPTSRCPV